jgi:hypothetical protein
MHPDKGGDASAFAQLKTAFETVSDPLKLQQWQRGQGGGAAAVDSVDIDCMAYDGTRHSFTHPCRCGGVFEAAESMLDLRWARTRRRICTACNVYCCRQVRHLPVRHLLLRPSRALLARSSSRSRSRSRRNSSKRVISLRQQRLQPPAVKRACSFA